MLNVIVLANGFIEDLGDPVSIVKWINLAHFHTISSHAQTLTLVIPFFNQKKKITKKNSRKVSCKQTHIFSMILTIFFFFLRYAFFLFLRQANPSL